MNKRFGFAALAVLASLSGVVAQPSAPKPPIGVPADAKLFNSKWYRVYFEETTWHRAKEKCAGLRGQLAVVPDAATLEFLKTLSKASLWLGATDEEHEGVWKWVDGSAVTLSPWVTDNPNNTAGKEHFLAMVTHNRIQGWNDFAKEGKAYNLKVTGYICEWKQK